MARLFTKTDCSVFTLDLNDVLDYVGRGELRLTRDVLENNALTDSWDAGVAGRARAEVTIELAGDDANTTSHALQVFNAAASANVALVITTDAGKIEGNFTVPEGGFTLEDAIREGITLRSIGEVAINQA